MARSINIPTRFVHLISPDVLSGTVERIEQAEQAEADNPALERRYLELHADNILTEATRRGQHPETGEEHRSAA